MPETAAAAKYNPYDFQYAVDDPYLFVGRGEEQAQITYYADQAGAAPHPTHLALIGKRASGKTSLLNMTAIWAKQRGIGAVRVNLDDQDAQSQIAFFFKIYNELLIFAFTEGRLGGLHGATYQTYMNIVNTYVLPDQNTAAVFPLLFPNQYALAKQRGDGNAAITEPIYRHDLEAISKALGHPIVLMIDEAGVLAESRVLLQKIRNTLMTIPGFMVMIAATPDLLAAMDEVFSPIIRQFKKIDVGPFKKYEATELLIRRPLEKLGLNATDLFDFGAERAVREIHDLAGGRPYEIQLICHILFRRVQEGRTDHMSLDYAALEELRRELESFRDFSRTPILAMVRNLAKEQLSALGVLGNCNGGATFDQLAKIQHVIRGDWHEDILNAHFAELLDMGVLEQSDGRVRFTGDDFDKVYIKYWAREQRLQCDFSDLPVHNFIFAVLGRHLRRYLTLTIIGAM
jgi:hypothetical protein